jgi:hypothetical protein
MKRSKIFLAISGGLLAVVGIAAAKTHRSGLTPGYYTNPNTANHFCTVVSQITGYTTSSLEGSTLKTQVDVNLSYTVWSKENASGFCHSTGTNHKLYTATAE